MDYDIIGDLHGHADALQALLRKLGYREERSAWRHPDRTAVFVGDLIDRGPKQLETVDIVRRMVDAGRALAVMGNHELNAIAWFLPDPVDPGEYLRPHRREPSGEKNRKQHERFLAEVDGRDDLHAEIIEWFLELPLWLDLPALRVVHACWHPESMECLARYLRPGNRVDEELMFDATCVPEYEDEKYEAYPTPFTAVEALTKGLEAPMPEGKAFSDKEGTARRWVRVRWWDPAAATLRDAALLPEEERRALPATPIPERARVADADARPVFFGHYWLTGEPAPLAPRAACLDYSIARGGRLCAYRYDGDPELSAERFVWVA